MPRMKKAITKENFTERIRMDKNGCWIWIKGKNKRGYGHVQLNGKMMRAHQASYRLFKGEIKKGLCVCHSCDVKLCCNPDHLWLGTHLENMQDRNRKGRQAFLRGEDNPYSTLTNEIVLSIRKYFKENKVTMADAGRKFGMARNQAWRIIKRQSWTHLEEIS